MSKNVNVERAYDSEGNLLVLYSPGYGTGWSTWYGLELALDKRIIEYFLNEHPSEEEMRNFLNDIGYNISYLGSGYHSLKCARIPQGRAFFILEYDGSEGIVLDEDFIEA